MNDAFIAVSDETQELNQAIDLIDTLTGYRFDREFNFFRLADTAYNLLSESRCSLTEWHNVAKACRIFREQAIKELSK